MPLELLSESLAESAAVLNIDSFLFTIPSLAAQPNPRKCFTHIARCFPRLRELVIRDLVKVQLPIDVSTLRPLLGLNGLKHVHFEYTDVPSRFCDQDMFEIASSWTQLEVFYLCWSKSRASPESDMRLTVAALTPFAENCPQMRRLFLAVDASLPPSIPPSTDARFGRCFQYWDILSSAIDIEGSLVSPISVFLLHIFGARGTLVWNQVGHGSRHPRWLELKSELEKLRRAQSVPLLTWPFTLHLIRFDIYASYLGIHRNMYSALVVD